MPKNQKEYGWDELYDAIDRADASYNRHEQKRLLKEQNKLLKDNEIKRQQDKEKDRELQTKLQKQIIEEQHLINEENRKHDNEIEDKRQSNNNKNRLQNLCDNIGISKSVIDNYEKTIAFSIEQNQLSKKIDDIENELKYLDLDELADELREIHELDEEYIDYNNTKIFEAQRKIGIYKKFKNNDFSGYPTDDDYICRLLDERFSLNLGIFFNIIGIFITIFLMSIAYPYLLVPGSFVVFYNIFRPILRLGKIVEIRKKIKSLCDGRIEEQEYIIKRINTTKKEIDDNKKAREKCIKDRSKFYKKEANFKKELDKIIKDNIKKNLEDLYQFRINHYNYDIEKLLLDFDFDKKYGECYKLLTEDESHKSGSIKQYNDYFLKKIKEYKKIKNEE